ncbi:MAG: type V CRISPR-associated protein Cas12a/Cpf1 [Bacteroidales bacterium]|nr:type V CRISPR-associated protein Cas12a/Cpf1 [Bacteroidales bacterium]MDD3913562.1 type V CRISPR-associated protein Cas12a/Cpf1 [Bacteroidales bacterium]MDD4633670.1 type V CRISPR-associated protein Cas12a/Cpf1 [Bacteroidales bacterium]
MKQFTNLYTLSKTLRFELIPIGKTLEYVQQNGLLTQDEQRADSYKKVKKIIDEYHKAFIERVLCNFKLQVEDEGKKNSLEEYFFYYNLPTNDEQRKKVFPDIQAKLRKQIVDCFTSDALFKRIDKKELIKEDLQSFVKTIEEKNLVAEFHDFTTYFTGFHENRQNMYSDEAKSTAIAYRLIHENLPKFIDNISTFEKVAATDVKNNFTKLYDEMSEYLNVKEIADIFKLSYYSKVLTQTQIDAYNAVIGGRAEEQGKPKIQGLNEYINLYNQDKNARLPKLKPLYKQILSDRNAISWLPEEFNNDNEVLENIEKCYQEISEKVLSGEHSLIHLLLNLKESDLSKIYLRNDLSLTNISQQLFGDWNIIKKAIEADFVNNNPLKKNEKAEKYEERKSKYLKSFDSISIGYINECLKAVQKEEKVQDYFEKAELTDKLTNQKNNIFTQIGNTYAEVKDLLNTSYPQNKNLSQDKVNIAKIKDLLEALKNLQHFIKPLLGNGDESDKDERFYGEFSAILEIIDSITPLYNKVRNYATRKPYSDEKIKLNFENSTLLDGWDVNKEPDNTNVILRKDGLYYLGIMNKKYNKIFESENIKSGGECYEKMDYKLLPGANKMLPKVFFSKSRIDEFAPSKEIQDNYAHETHKKGATFNIDDCHKLIDFFKNSINKHEDWKNFNFKFSDTNSYEDLSWFYREVEQQGYKITFRNVSESYINQLVEEGKLYLFQIYNKDFSPFSKGTPNMHTLYWKMLFDEQNLANVVYKLNGHAEVFFRKKSISWSDEVMQKGHHYDKLKEKFDYPIIKDRRYTVDKFQFHVPINMNFKAAGINDINEKVNTFLKESNATHIIGIDRGERHLLYLTLIDLNGNIKKQFSLNEIVNEYNGNTYKTNYHDLLDVKEKEREKARENWQASENIKELREGYLSQVIYKITQLMVQYNAIVVLEDLNFGFIRGRQKVEKSVYQQFEHKLIDKLNYLVDKKADADADGGLLHAYQLANKFVSFQKLGKQSGFLFYIPAWNTSKMDPTTGFVNLFDTRYENEDKAKAFFEKFDSIKYNADKNWFEFAFDYIKFTAKAEGTRTKWTLCTYGNRIETFRNPEKNNQWYNKKIDLTETFKDFFNGDYQGDLKAKILTQTGKPFWEGLLHLLKLTLQMRNSITGTDTDYLISPVMNEQGEFYDSRTCADTLPKNADANGAYNIARKGLWVIEQIKKAEDLRKIKLAITNKEWLWFAQKKPYNNH